uniref:Uncharacterized protein n=1 Tax=Anolis carolinensis TaxID=28377 RepID=A0A803TWW6_ANOCA
PIMPLPPSPPPGPEEAAPSPEQHYTLVLDHLGGEKPGPPPAMEQKAVEHAMESSTFKAALTSTGDSQAGPKSG